MYELLTQQYEIAKVEEAKEIPTVKVLDAAIVPTKKTFPPRTVIVILGMMLGTTMAMIWVMAKTRWDAVEASDPRKAFAMEVYTTMRVKLPRFSEMAQTEMGTDRMGIIRKMGMARESRSNVWKSISLRKRSRSGLKVSKLLEIQCFTVNLAM